MGLVFFHPKVLMTSNNLFLNTQSLLLKFTQHYRMLLLAIFFYMSKRYLYCGVPLSNINHGLPVIPFRQQINVTENLLQSRIQQTQKQFPINITVTIF